MESITGKVKISIEDFELLRKKEIELRDLKEFVQCHFDTHSRVIIGIIDAYIHDDTYKGVYIHKSDLRNKISEVLWDLNNIIK